MPEVALGVSITAGFCFLLLVCLYVIDLLQRICLIIVKQEKYILKTREWPSTPGSPRERTGWPPARRGPLEGLGGRVGLCQKSKLEGGVPGRENGTGKDATDFKGSSGKESGEAAGNTGTGPATTATGKAVDSGMAREAGVPQRAGPSLLPPDGRRLFAFEGLVSLS